MSNYKGRPKGAKGKRTIAIAEAVENCFRAENKNGAYLKRLARLDNPALFVTLLAKCIPQAVALDIKVHEVDLGLAMREAQDRLNVLHRKPVTLEHVTEQPSELLLEQAHDKTTRQPVRVSRETVARDADKG